MCSRVGAAMLGSPVWRTGASQAPFHWKNRARLDVCHVYRFDLQTDGFK